MKGLFCILALVTLLNTDTVYCSENKDIKHTCRAYERIYNKYCYHTTSYECNKIKYFLKDKCHNYNVDPQEFCPLIQLVDDKLCNQSVNLQTVGVNPQDFCPLISLVDQKLCEQEISNRFGVNPQDFCPLIQLIDQKLCNQSVNHKNLSVNPQDFCPLISLVDQKLCNN